jgi:DNA repair protein RecN (Recombination protein N)
MLAHLSVRDFAIVERLELELRAGMTVLTGETGAGKSILIDALGLTLGERASTKVVRSGAAQAEVVAVFELAPGSEAARHLESHDLTSRDDECILRRTVSADGRSRAYINGRPTPLQMLRELGDLLVDIHGQHEHQSLLKATAQRRILDEYADHGDALGRLAALVDRWQETRAAIDALTGGPEAREQRLDYLRYQVAELDALDVRSEELEALDEEHRRLSHASELLAICARSLDDIEGDDGSGGGSGDRSISSRLASIMGGLEEMIAIDKDVEDIRALLDGAGIQLREAAAGLRHYRDRIDVDPERLRMLEQRVSAIHDAARKHRVETRELPALHAALRSEIEAIEGAGARLAELRDTLDAVQKSYADAAGALHESRASAAETLSEVVTKNVQALGMPKGRFEIVIESDPDAPPSRSGYDSVAFEVAINPGQPLMPLAKVASGGELSRISLAIQVIATRMSGVPTLIFDEVDAGVGGRVAEIVGRELRRLADKRQVLCVTHLPQVASLAQQHVQVQKRSKRRETHTDLRSLSGEGRVEEIARMLGGVTITDQALAHAREMLEQA